VPRASQQPGGLHSPGELKGDGVHTLPGSTQVMLMEHRREGSRVLNGGQEQNRGGQSGSTKTGGKEVTAEQGEYIAKGGQQAQEGTEHYRGGQSRQGGGVWGAPSNGRGAAQCTGYAQMLVQLAEWLGASEARE